MNRREFNYILSRDKDAVSHDKAILNYWVEGYCSTGYVIEAMKEVNRHLVVNDVQEFELYLNSLGYFKGNF